MTSRNLRKYLQYSTHTNTNMHTLLTISCTQLREISMSKCSRNIIEHKICFLKNIFCFTWKSELQRERRAESERERESVVFYLLVYTQSDTKAGSVRSWQPGDSSGFPSWVQEPKNLGHHLLPSQAISSEQKWKWSRQDTNRWTYRMPALKIENLSDKPLYQRQLVCA